MKAFWERAFAAGNPPELERPAPEPAPTRTCACHPSICHYDRYVAEMRTAAHAGKTPTEPDLVCVKRAEVMRAPAYVLDRWYAEITVRDHPDRRD